MTELVTTTAELERLQLWPSLAGAAPGGTGRRLWRAAGN